jgi:hypothetical protein
MAKIIWLMIPQKAPSLKGIAVVSSWRGIPILRRWPKKRKRPLPEKTQEQNDWFTQANRLTKYIAPQLQIVARDAVAGTPLYPRDIQIQLMAGTLFSIKFPGEGIMYSMATRRAVSDSIDVLGQTESGILYRGADFWDVLPPDTAGKVLTTQGPNTAPSWEDAAGGGGGIWNEIANLDAPAAGVFDFQGLDFSSYREIQIVFTDLKPTISEGFFNLQIFDGGTLVTTGYDWSYQAYSTSNFSRTARVTGAPAIAVTGSGTNWGVNFSTLQGFSGTLTITDPDIVADRLCYWIGTHQQVTGFTNGYRGAGKIDVVSQLDGIRISEATNPIASGKVKIIGLKKDPSSPSPPPPGPANVLWKEIAFVTAPAGGRYDIKNLDLTPYRVVQIQISNFAPIVNDAVILLGVFVGGTLITAGYRYTTQAQSDNGFALRSNSVSSGGVLLQPPNNAWKVAKTPGVGMSATIILSEPTTTGKKLGSFIGTNEAPSGIIESNWGSFAIPAGAAIDGFSLYAIGVSIGSGKVRIIGLA